MVQRGGRIWQCGIQQSHRNLRKSQRDNNQLL